MSEESKLVANPLVVLREELDDWAILFDPSTGDGFAVNPVSVFIWNRLNGKHTVQDILTELRDNCDNVPDDAESFVDEFIQDLVKRGLAGYEIQNC